MKPLAVPLPAFTTDPRRACLGFDPRLFTTDEPTQVEVEAAKLICQRCPFEAECLDWAVAAREVGVWGATTDAERDWIRAGRPEARSAQIAARRAAVHNLHRDGATAADIAVQLGVSENLVFVDLAALRRAETLAAWPDRDDRIRAACAGIVVALSKDELAEALDVYDQGRTLAQVAERLRCSAKTVRMRREARHKARTAVAA